MKGRPSRLLATLVAVAALGIGGSGIAMAANGSSNSTPPTNSTQTQTQEPADEPAQEPVESEKGGAPESAADTAAQEAACNAAGITGDNVQFDDVTGSCSLDTGSDSGE
jgi:hypothetical protein